MVSKIFSWFCSLTDHKFERWRVQYVLAHITLLTQQQNVLIAHVEEVAVGEARSKGLWKLELQWGDEWLLTWYGSVCLALVDFGGDWRGNPKGKWGTAPSTLLLCPTARGRKVSFISSINITLDMLVNLVYKCDADVQWQCYNFISR